MPLRHVPTIAALVSFRRGVRPLHASSCLRRDEVDSQQTHYEALNLSPTASPAEIKRCADTQCPPYPCSFLLNQFLLPDPSTACPRSTTRTTTATTPRPRAASCASPRPTPCLSHHDKRAAYDRDMLGRPAQASGPPRRGSYHGGTAAGPAGGRAASGLSRRRGAFRGPPPSFFRSGGWGTQATKRRAAHDESTGNAGASPASAGRPREADEPPHFDRTAHERRQRRIDEDRASRMAARGHDGPAAARDVGSVAGFFRRVRRAGRLRPGAVCTLRRVRRPKEGEGKKAR